MIEGADKVDASLVRTLKPMQGFDGRLDLTLVRNPDYDPKTDSPAARQNLPDEFVFTIDPNVNDIVDRVAAGELEDENGAEPAAADARAVRDATRRSAKYLHLNSGDLVDYLTMNLTQPPFDDVHVRRAMNWIIDKAALRQVWGGPLIGKIAGHIVPDSIFDNQLAEYDPYATPGDHGSLAKAKAAMKGSKYDTDRDGTCSAHRPATTCCCCRRRARTFSADAAGRSRRTRSRSGSRSTSRDRTAPSRRSRRRPRTSRSRPSRAGRRTTPTR